MKTRIFGFILMLGMVGILGACQPSTQPEVTPATPTPGGEPTDSATPTPTPGSTP
jgi:hypothetical protein